MSFQIVNQDVLFSRDDDDNNWESLLLYNKLPFRIAQTCIRICAAVAGTTTLGFAVFTYLCNCRKNKDNNSSTNVYFEKAL